MYQFQVLCITVELSYNILGLCNTLAITLYTLCEERIPTRCNNIDNLLSIQMLIIDYSLDMFRASLCPSSGEKTTCYCVWGIFAGSVGCGRLRYCGATLRV